MKEYLKKELDDIIAKQPRKRVDRWLRIAVIFVGILVSAFALNWFRDYQTSQQSVIDVVKSVSDKVSNIESTVTRVENKIIRVEKKQDISDSAQNRINKLLINGLPKEDKREAKLLQEIYDQMKRDQSPQDRRISDNESYIEPIQPIEKELQVYVEPIKKKLR
jgi:hypothetical protein